MAVISLTEALSVPDVLSTDMFRLELGTLPGVSSNNLVLKCQSFVVAEENNEMYQQKIGVHTRGFRGQGEYGHQLATRFVEDVTCDTGVSLRTWSQQINGLISGTSSGYLKDYSITAGATIYDTTGKAVETWTLYNFFITNIEEIELEYGEAQAMMYQASFWFDYKKSSLITYR